MSTLNAPAPSVPLRDAVRQIPTAHKIVRHRLLNQLGCQVGRVVAAEVLLRWRRRRLAIRPTDVEAALLRDGVVCVPGFFDEGDFAMLLAEADRAERTHFTKRSDADKFGIERQKLNVLKHRALFPESIRLILGHPGILRLARLAEGWSKTDDFGNQGAGLTYERLEQVQPTGVSAARDPEVSSGDLHTDTFHSVTKAFLTLNDVTLSNSPYAYAIGSQRLTPARLIWEYRNSIRPQQYDSTQYHNRLWEDEQRRMGVEAASLQVPRNTLIVTNTFGFHRRGPMLGVGEVRRMLRLDFRSNPFQFLR